MLPGFVLRPPTDWALAVAIASCPRSKSGTCLDCCQNWKSLWKQQCLNNCLNEGPACEAVGYPGQAPGQRGDKIGVAFYDSLQGCIWSGPYYKPGDQAQDTATKIQCLFGTLVNTHLDNYGGALSRFLEWSYWGDCDFRALEYTKSHILSVASTTSCQPQMYTFV